MKPPDPGNPKLFATKELSVTKLSKLIKFKPAGLDRTRPVIVRPLAEFLAVSVTQVNKASLREGEVSGERKTGTVKM